MAQHYGGGGGQVDPQISQWFSAVDVDRSGRITAPELQSALMSSNGKKFNDTATKLMIGTFITLIIHLRWKLSLTRIKLTSSFELKVV